MVIAVLPVALLSVKPRSRRDIYLASDNGIDAFFFCRLIKIDHAVHDAVIGNSRSRHAELFDPAYVLGDLIGTVQKRILCMDVKMCERHSISFFKSSIPLRPLEMRPR